MEWGENQHSVANLRSAQPARPAWPGRQHLLDPW